MGVQDLQQFMENPSVPGGAVNVDLLRIARNLPTKPAQQGGRNRNRPQQNQPNKLKLVVDGECCLDRLYGGYFSDWACGGQWNRTIQFLSLLMHAVERGNMELAIVFNGAMEPQRMNEWKAQQAATRERVNKVLKHIHTKGTPPPKVWWTAPVCLRTVLRMVFRHLNVTVLCSMDDHHQEVIAYCRENNFHGLLADDAEYAVFDPPRYFSSKHLKLTYKGSLETKEYMVNELNKSLEITREQLCIVAALMGNNLLSENDLRDFYKSILENNKLENNYDSIKAIALFVKSLPDPNNLDNVTKEVFGSSTDPKALLLRQSIQYYLNGTKEGFLRYRSANNSRRFNKKNKDKNQTNENNVSSNNQANNVSNGNAQANSQAKLSEEADLDLSGFASETTEREQKSLEDYKLATANAVMTPDIIIEQPCELESNSSSKLTSGIGSNEEYDSSVPSSDNSRMNGQMNGNVPSATSLLISSSSSSSSSITASPTKQTTIATPPTKNKEGGTTKNQKKTEQQTPNVKLAYVAPEVLRTASERHQKGLMSPLILQILTHGEVRLPCLLEDEHHREIPPVYNLFKPIRQNVYAILFNLHHLQYVARSKEKDGEKVELPEVHVKEWVWSKANNYDKPVIVRAEPLGWGVPTIQRLWFGAALDDKRRRLRALLTCLRSDTSLMLNTSYVPQHLLIMACVLRYIMSIPDQRILRRQELDAFITQAFAPELMNPQYLQELTLPLVTSRGVQLSTLFMQGVETALFANDACGAPIPLLMCCPWLFFDGKLFHHKLARAAVVKNLLELCENHIEHVVKVERMRKAILDGLSVQFAKPMLPPIAGGNMLRPGYPPPNCLPALNLPSARTGRGLGRRPVPSRGGQLEVAGVVVSNWGANYGRTRSATQRQQPQITSVGYPAAPGVVGRNRLPGAGNTGFQMSTFPTHPTKPFRMNNVGRGRRNAKKKNQNKNNKNKARGVTVETNSGTVLASELLKNGDGIKEETVAATTTTPITNSKDQSSRQHIEESSITKTPTTPVVELGQGDAPSTLETTTSA